MSKTATQTAPQTSPTKTRTRGATTAGARPGSRSRGVASSGSTGGEERCARTLSLYIEERFDEFSKSQKDVARYIIDHLDEAAFQTAEELARRAATSSSTVVRFSQALGFEGYPELQQAAIEEYRRNGAEASRGGQLFDFDQSPFESSLSSDHSNLEETARKLSREQVEACVAAVADARRVVLVGMDQMAFFASYMRHLLALLDIRAEVIATPRRESIAKIGYVEEEDLVIGFSAGRAHPFLVRAMKLARHRGARIIAISDSTLSEIGEHAEQILYYSSDSPSYSRSNIALLAMVQALVHGVYARDKSAFDDQIRAYKLK